MKSNSGQLKSHIWLQIEYNLKCSSKWPVAIKRKVSQQLYVSRYERISLTVSTVSVLIIWHECMMVVLCCFGTINGYYHWTQKYRWRLNTGVAKSLRPRSVDTNSISRTGDIFSK